MYSRVSRKVDTCFLFGGFFRNMEATENEVKIACLGTGNKILNTFNSASHHYYPFIISLLLFPFYYYPFIITLLFPNLCSRLDTCTDLYSLNKLLHCNSTLGVSVYDHRCSIQKCRTSDLCISFLRH